MDLPMRSDRADLLARKMTAAYLLFLLALVAHPRSSGCTAALAAAAAKAAADSHLGLVIGRGGVTGRHPKGVLAAIRLRGGGGGGGGGVGEGTRAGVAVGGEGAGHQEQKQRPGRSGTIDYSVGTQQYGQSAQPSCSCGSTPVGGDGIVKTTWWLSHSCLRQCRIAFHHIVVPWCMGRLLDDCLLTTCPCVGGAGRRLTAWRCHPPCRMRMRMRAITCCPRRGRDAAITTREWMNPRGRDVSRAAARAALIRG